MKANRYDHITDAELLNLYRADKNQEWIGVLLERYTLLLLGVCMKYLKDETEARDCVQQIFLKVLTEVGKYKIDKLGTVEIYLKEKTPYIKLPTYMEYRILQADPKTFYIPGIDIWASFHKRFNGVYESILWRNSHSQVVGERIVE